MECPFKKYKNKFSHFVFEPLHVYSVKDNEWTYVIERKS